MASAGRDDLFQILRAASTELGLRLPAVAVEPAAAQAPGLTAGALAARGERADVLLWDLDAPVDDPGGAVGLVRAALSRDGLLCVTGSDGRSLPAGLEHTMHPVLDGDGWSIHARRDAERPLRSTRYRLDLSRRRRAYREACADRAARGRGEQPLVTVVVLAYRHEAYLGQCLASVLAQQGAFRLRVLVLDDASTDGTAQVAAQAFEQAARPGVTCELHVHEHNVGEVANLAAAVKLAQGCDYLTFCEGDDFWSDDTRVAQHIEFLEQHPDCVLSFNTIELCEADGSDRRVYAEHEQDARETLDGHALAAGNVIGNFSACFYRGAVTDVVPDDLFSMYTVDWAFNLYCAQFGRIGHLRRPLSVYRQHEAGAWSARPTLDKAVRLLRLIGEYDAFLDYRYTDGLSALRRRYHRVIAEAAAGTDEKPFDLIVLDDVFPSRRSGFRLVEFCAYLHAFPSAVALTSGLSLPVLGDETLAEAIAHLGRDDPEAGSRVLVSDGEFPLELGRLLYVDFLNNATALLPAAEAAGVPFAFTLYPGGGLLLHDEECDRKLRRVFSSPCFRRVFVTQQVTYDYIVAGGLCPPEAVELIFGVVMPPREAQPEDDDRLRWGLGKSTLDVCFMAHRYMPTGEDKGYDVFLDVARRLAERHDDVRFHVVGPYDETVLPLDGLDGLIEFHGTLDPEEFDAFFRGMDLIVSPNISGRLFPGAFDGFPTASCTEAALRGVAVAAVDEFGSATGHFTDGEDIILIPHDADGTAGVLESYCADPAALRDLGRRGRVRTLELYSLEAQIGPRLAVLKELVGDPSPRAPGPERAGAKPEETQLGALLLCAREPAPAPAAVGRAELTELETRLREQTAHADELNRRFVAAHAELGRLHAQLARLQASWPRRLARALRDPRAAWRRVTRRPARHT